MAKLAGRLVNYPARVSFVWYLVLIALGTLLLAHPLSHGNAEQPISLLDASFTATSATCVTGLVVRSTANDFTLAGQIVILSLIQLGGIGIMTVTTFIMFQLGGRQGLHHRAVLSDVLGARGNVDLRSILRSVILMTLMFEAIGFVILTARNLFEFTFAEAMWRALFHSVSAFCNAGFALHDDSLSRYGGDVVVNITIGALVVIGGIGFPVILDLKQNWRGPWSQRWERLHLHTKLMLVGTAVLLLVGAASFLALEWEGVLKEMPLWKRFIVAAFHSITCRTAGFNTVNIAAMTNASLFLSVILMAIGAGPCSTAGGLKVSTLSVLVLHARAAFRGESRVKLARRTIPPETIAQATATTIVFSTIAVLALTVLLMIEQSGIPHPQSQGKFLDAAFEVVSALGTVGLSTGMTPHLSEPGRLIVMFLMFLGRLGPISVFVVFSRGQRTNAVEFPAEEPLIG